MTSTVHSRTGPAHKAATAGISLRRRLRFGFQAAALWTSWTVLALLPHRAALWVAGLIAQTIGPDLSFQKKIEENLGIAFPEQSAIDIRRLSRRIWRHVGVVGAEYTHYHPSRLGPGGDIEIVGWEETERLARRGPLIYVGAHVGPWELPPVVLSQLGVDFMAIYSPRTNPFADRQIQRSRNRTAPRCRLVPKGVGAVRSAVEHLRRGDAVFLLADQRVIGGDILPFFGRQAETTTTPARLARRFGCPILPVLAERLDGAGYRVTFSAPLLPDPSRPAEEDERALTIAINTLFETWIRERPEQWFCLKRRWRIAAKVYALEGERGVGAPAAGVAEAD